MVALANSRLGLLCGNKGSSPVAAWGDIIMVSEIFLSVVYSSKNVFDSLIRMFISCEVAERRSSYSKTGYFSLANESQEKMVLREPSYCPFLEGR